MVESNTAGQFPNIYLPWRVDIESINAKNNQTVNLMKEKVARIAADFGLPASMFSFIGGWLLGCPYCVAAGEVVKLYEQGKINREQHKELFMMAANAKDQGDEQALNKLKGTLEALRRSN